MKMIQKRFPVIVFSLLFLIGLGIMLYPYISNYFYKNIHNEVIRDYVKLSQNYTDNSRKEALRLASNYNKTLTEYSVVDVFTNPKEGESLDYLNILNINNDGVMGYIEIPKIGVKLPIYHGTSEKSLQKGVGHLEGSSLPIGGVPSHAVLSAHRGLPSAKLFTDLNQVELKDVFYVHILDQVLAYEVDQVRIVEPSEIESLQLEKNHDYVTLVTCTPYAINTHRLLVRGTRVEYQDEVLKVAQAASSTSRTSLFFYFTIGIIGIVSIVFFLFVRNIMKNYEVREVVEEEIELL